MSEAESHQPSAELAQAAGELLTLASASESRAMHRLVELAARHVPGCSGAAALLCQDGEVTLAAATTFSRLGGPAQRPTRWPRAGR